MDEQTWALFDGAGRQSRQPGGDHRLHHRDQAHQDLHRSGGRALAGKLRRGGFRGLPADVGQGGLLRGCGRLWPGVRDQPFLDRRIGLDRSMTIEMIRGDVDQQADARAPATARGRSETTNIRPDQ